MCLITLGHMQLNTNTNLQIAPAVLAGSCWNEWRDECDIVSLCAHVKTQADVCTRCHICS